MSWVVGSLLAPKRVRMARWTSRTVRILAVSSTLAGRGLDTRAAPPL
jgi:hypothetical protein